MPLLGNTGGRGLLGHSTVMETAVSVTLGAARPANRASMVVPRCALREYH